MLIWIKVSTNGVAVHEFPFIIMGRTLSVKLKKKSKCSNLDKVRFDISPENYKVI